MVPNAPNVLFENDDTFIDQSHRAGKVLDRILSGDDGTTTPERGSLGPQVDVAKERSARPILDTDSGRTTSRLLLVTRDLSILSTDSAFEHECIELSQQFDEVHVMALVPRRGVDASKRRGDRLWVYSVYSPYWWSLPFHARKAAEELLVFNDSVRPDLVVGADPYEAGLAAYFIAKAFARPLQIHIADDFTDHSFLRKDPLNIWRRRIAGFVLKRVMSVRVKTQTIHDAVAKRFPKIKDLSLLPKFSNFTGFIGATPAFNVHDRYRDFSFIALTFGPLTADSHLHNVFTALHNVLKTPRIGLVVVGDGPGKKLFEEKVKLLGIEKNVVFVSAPDDLVAYMRTSDALIETGTSRESEEHIMRAAAAGLPIIAVSTDLRKDLFKDGRSAFLTSPDNMLELSQKFVKFLNNPTLRTQFAAAGEDIARNRFDEDPSSYYASYRDTIEVILETTVPAEVRENATKPKALGERTVGSDGMSYPSMAGVRAQPST